MEDLFGQDPTPARDEALIIKPAFVSDAAVVPGKPAAPGQNDELKRKEMAPASYDDCSDEHKAHDSKLPRMQTANEAVAPAANEPDAPLEYAAPRSEEPVAVIEPSKDELVATDEARAQAQFGPYSTFVSAAELLKSMPIDSGAEAEAEEDEDEDAAHRGIWHAATHRNAGDEAAREMAAHRAAEAGADDDDGDDVDDGVIHDDELEDDDVIEGGQAVKVHAAALQSAEDAFATVKVELIKSRRREQMLESRCAAAAALPTVTPSQAAAIGPPNFDAIPPVDETTLPGVPLSLARNTAEPQAATALHAGAIACAADAMDAIVGGMGIGGDDME